MLNEAPVMEEVREDDGSVEEAAECDELLEAVELVVGPVDGEVHNVLDTSSLALRRDCALVVSHRLKLHLVLEALHLEFKLRLNERHLHCMWWRSMKLIMKLSEFGF